MDRLNCEVLGLLHLLSDCQWSCEAKRHGSAYLEFLIIRRGGIAKLFLFSSSFNTLKSESLKLVVRLGISFFSGAIHSKVSSSKLRRTNCKSYSSLDTVISNSQIQLLS